MPIVDGASLARLALGGLLLGGALVAVYDVWRVFRACFGGRVAALLLQAGDLLWGIFCGCAVAVFLSAVYDGRFRWPFALGLALGILIWCLTLGRLVRALTPGLARLIRRLFAWIFRLLGRPLVWMWRAGGRVLSAIRQSITGPIYTRGAMRRTKRLLSQVHKTFEMEG